MTTLTLARPRAPSAAFAPMVLNEARLAWRQPAGMIAGAGVALLLLVIEKAGVVVIAHLRGPERLVTSPGLGVWDINLGQMPIRLKTVLIRMHVSVASLSE